MSTNVIGELPSVTNTHSVRTLKARTSVFAVLAGRGRGRPARTSTSVECVVMPWACGLEAWCFNEQGGYSCACVQGTATDGTSCRWTLEKAAQGQDFVAGIATDRWGGPVILIQTDGHLGPGSGLPRGSGDIGVVHLDFQGNRDWMQTLGSPSMGYPGGIAMDVDGNVYVVGTAAGPFDAQPTHGWADAFVAKYDVSGHLAWLTYLGTEAYEGATGVALPGDSLCVAVFPSGVLPTQSSMGGTDAFVARVLLDGTPVWYRQTGTAGCPGDGAALSDEALTLRSMGAKPREHPQVNIVVWLVHLAQDHQVPIVGVPQDVVELGRHPGIFREVPAPVEDGTVPWVLHPGVKVEGNRAQNRVAPGADEVDLVVFGQHGMDHVGAIPDDSGAVRDHDSPLPHSRIEPQQEPLGPDGPQIR